MIPTIGFIGLGTMGGPMAARLLEQGLRVAAWNRTLAKAAEMIARGAVQAASPRELAAQSDLVITMVSDGTALVEVALGQHGIAAGLAAGKVHCDMSTVDTASTTRLLEHYTARGAEFVHAPVLGNWRAAAAGKLLIFAGGADSAVAKCEPVFAALGQRVWRWPRPEQAGCVKLACNLLLGGMMELFCESLAFADKAGVNPETLVEIIGSSALAAPMYGSKGGTIVARDFTPSFFLRHMRKDLNLALAAAGLLGAALPGTRAIRDVYHTAAERGFASADYSAVIQLLEAGNRE